MQSSDFSNTVIKTCPCTCAVPSLQRGGGPCTYRGRAVPCLERRGGPCTYRGRAVPCLQRRGGPCTYRGLAVPCLQRGGIVTKGFQGTVLVV